MNMILKLSETIGIDKVTITVGVLTANCWTITL